MKVFFQYEDERAIMHDHPLDGVAAPVANFLAEKFKPEIIYIHRWMDGYTYDGTAHTPTETILFQIRDNTLFFLPRSGLGQFTEGKPLQNHPKCLVVMVEDL